jgi:kynurenine 3-monooxygenase
MMLAERGYAVDLVDGRPDPATSQPEQGRSVHLVLSHRGWRTLRALGIDESIRELCMPLSGRRIHLWRGDTLQQAYAHDGSTIHCVGRARLQAELIAHARKRPRISMRWRSRLRWLDLEGRRAGFSDEDGGPSEVRWQPFERLCAADGAFSAVRSGVQRGRFDHHQSWLDLGYKEINLPAPQDGGPSLSTRHFQLWPRNRLFFAAFPNADGSFTGSLFMPWKGTPSFDSIHTEADFHALVRTFFPDLADYTDTLWPQYRDNPVCGLATVKCSPWHWDHRVLLLGDAAHAVVPFFGQGMNSGFEDVRVLAEELDAADDDWAKALPSFEAVRRPNVDALADMSVSHYHHLNHIPDRLDPLRARVGHALDSLVPWRFRPLYELVAFTSIPYAAAYRLSQLRTQVIEDIVHDPAFENGWPDDAETRLLERAARA